MDKKIFEDYHSMTLDGDYRGWRFYNCNLRATRLVGDFSGAEFYFCDMTLLEADGNFEKILVHRCDAQKSDWKKASLKLAQLVWTDFAYCDFRGSDLRGVLTDNSKFNYSKFKDAKLSAWSREIVSELLRQEALGLEMEMLAAYVKTSEGLCWKEFLGLEELKCYEKSISILTPYFKEIIERGGLLCHQ